MNTKNINNFIKKDVVKILGTVGFLTTIKMGTAFLSNKVVALYLGPPGIALIGQLWNFSNIMQTISSGGINTGVTKYIAEFRKDKETIRRILITSFTIVTTNSILISIILVLFRDFLSNTILNANIYSIVFAFFGVTIVFFNYNNLFIAIINGFNNYRSYFKLNVAMNISNLLLTVTLIYFFDKKGALISIVISGSIVFFYSFNLLKNEDWFSNVFSKLTLYKTEFKLLLLYAIMTLISATINPISQVIIRTNIISSISIEKAGIWESINRMSSFYLFIITNTLAVYFIPKISALDMRDIKKEVISFYKLVLPLTLSMQIFIYLLRYHLVIILFSKEFIIVTELIYIQLLGDFFKVSVYVLSYLLVAKAMTVPFIATEILFNINLIAFTMVGLNYWGLSGLLWGYVVSSIINFTILGFYISRVKFETRVM